MKLELPYLMSDRDRHGNRRFYVRRKGKPKIRLRGRPGSTSFLKQYQAALDGPETTTSGTLAWLCEEYYRTPEFRALNRDTQNVRRAHLTSICQRALPNGTLLGKLPFAKIEAKNVRQIRDQWAEVGPDAANGRVKALRMLLGWAIEAEHMTGRNPARDIPKLKGNPDGFHTWTVEEVEQYRTRHPIGSKARLALELLLFTGTRRSDVVKLGRQMARGGWLSWTETKGYERQVKESAVPILPALQAVIDASPTGDMIYLVTEFGKPFTVAGFGNKMRDWCNQAGLPHCSAHGLRKAGATFAAENGATEHQLMAIYGWSSPKQAAHYTRNASRRRMAGDGMRLLVMKESV